MAWSVVDPSTEAVIAELELAGPESVDVVVSRAKAAFPAWSAMAPADRARLMRRFAECVADHGEELARLESRNVGKPIDGARWEAAAVSDVLHYYAGAVDKHLGHTYPVSGGVAMTFNEPLGVCGLIVPWNYPMMIAAWKLGPALACGNTVVLKPSELTPLTALRLGELALDSGIPEGVVNVLVGNGADAGQRLVEHPDVAKIGFTGSTLVGQQIMVTAAATLKRITLELGGKSACIVFADADLEAAAAGVVGATYDNSGQDCCARGRFLVERSVYDQVVDLVVQASQAVRTGPPSDAASTMGPLVSAAHLAKVRSFIDGSSHVAYQGEVPPGPGFWFPPTVLADVDPSSRVAQEEVFGPVVGLIPFDSEADAVRIANATAFGLSGSVWTRDGARGLRVARALQSGTLSINSNSSVRYSTPFGGVKQSGLGRDLSMAAMDHYSDTKTVFISTTG